MAILPIIQEDIIYDDESVFEEDEKIKKRHNLKLLITITIYYEESKHHCKRMKKEHSGDKERNRRDQVDVNILMMSTAKHFFVELFSPGMGICVFFSPGVGTFSHGVGDHFSFSSGVDDMALLMALMFS
jgi:hypothetical protein